MLAAEFVTPLPPACISSRKLRVVSVKFCKRSDHPDHAVGMSSRRSRPSSPWFTPERSTARKGAPGFGAATTVADPCVRAPFWHFGCDDGRLGGLHPHPAGELRDGFRLLRPLVSSAPSCALSGTPYSDTSSLRSSSRASPPPAHGPDAGTPRYWGRCAPPAFGA
jgi:hypothetical protein